ncbi:MAG: biopolymer transporter ExbD [Candidatus Caenarcaniphilales bacterium]|nr:biopolymer transporter ExbD [Candidatus Caenarcaniphilales bacterium]
MGFSGGNNGSDFSEINITPLTDVFLILFLIMVVIAPMINETSLPITPPAAKNGAAAQNEGKVINLEISAEGLIAINNKKLSPDPIAPEQVNELVTQELELIRQDSQYFEAPLNLIADSETKQKFVVGALDAASGLGIKKLNIVTVTQN